MPSGNKDRSSKFQKINHWHAHCQKVKSTNQFLMWLKKKEGGCGGGDREMTYSYWSKKKKRLILMKPSCIKSRDNTVNNHNLKLEKDKCNNKRYGNCENKGSNMHIKILSPFNHGNKEQYSKLNQITLLSKISDVLGWELSELHQSRTRKALHQGLHSSESA